MAKKVRRRPTIQTVTDSTEEPSVKVNKSQLIRDYLSTNPGAMPKTAAEAISTASGVTVSPNAVSLIKAKLGSKKASKKAAAAGDTVKASTFDAIRLLYRAARGANVPREKIDAAFLLLAGDLE